MIQSSMTAAMQYSAKAIYQLAGFVSGKPVSSSLWKALTMNGMHAANQKRSTRGYNATQTHSSGIVWLQARSMC